MTIEVRRIHAEELVAFLETTSTAFLETIDAPKVAEGLLPLWDLERAWGAFDAGRMCGTFRSWHTELTVPGRARLPAAAVAGVTVLPTHRRRGILRRLAAAEHGAARERGEKVSILHSAEYPIYGRLGYGPAVQGAAWTLDALATGFHGPPPSGVELVKPDDVILEAVKGVFEAHRLRQVGEIRRRESSWPIGLNLRPSPWGERPKAYLALRRDAAGTVDGFAQYGAEEKWERNQPRNVLRVGDLFAASDEAYAALWRFLAEVDLVATVRAERRSPDERLPWLLTNARAATAELVDSLWVRLLDVQAALEARRYERTGSLVLEVIDGETGDRTVLRLDAGPDGATARPTTASPDLTLHEAALGAAYLGGAPLRHAVLAHGVDEHTAGALAGADALFRTLDSPVSSTFF
jgi:predicted acetyltransferase